MPVAVSPNREGYTFAGYYSEIDGDGTLYYNDAMTSVTDWDIGSDTTLYAYWTGEGPNTTHTVTKTVTNMVVVNEFTTEVPKSIVGKDKIFEATSEGMKIEINGLSLLGYEDKKVDVFIQKIDKGYFDLDVGSTFIEAMPVFDISIIVEGVKIPFGSDIPIEIAFELKGDYENHKIVPIYIARDGSYEILEGVYDGNQVRFKTSHLSDYTLIYRDKSFDDITTHWCKEAVEALAARDIISGKSEGVFDPSGLMTRAEVAQMLYNLLSRLNE